MHMNFRRTTDRKHHKRSKRGSTKVSVCSLRPSSFLQVMFGDDDKNIIMRRVKEKFDLNARWNWNHKFKENSAVFSYISISVVNGSMVRRVDHMIHELSFLKIMNQFVDWRFICSWTNVVSYWTLISTKIMSIVQVRGLYI